MRLKNIKLAGFKSFVDPTTVDIKSNLTAVVGPNGSGKSNIIDAVRWVMGESSAKYLRGESMTDVIFNGSSGRKPAAHASIELTFDNAEGKLGGQFAAYATLSLKREVTREGQSNYYLNNTRCRRKDIKDIFLGTGLGPRSYAIIMQDTISRLVEAKPEEFRAYIEEVAGIAKYKERRHETELRIKHTRENLDRLTDLREELDTQLRRLDRQAKAAERYKVLKQEQRTTQAQLYALQWQSYDAEHSQKGQTLLEKQTLCESIMAKIRSADAQFEEKRQIQVEANDAVNDAQATFYSLGADISKIEQAKQHQQERYEQLQQDLDKVTQQHSQARAQLSEDKSQLESLEQTSAQLQPEMEAIQMQASTVQEALHETEADMQNWQTQWDTFNETQQQINQKIQVEKTKIQHLEQQKQELSSRFGQLQSEQEALQIDNEDATVISLENELVQSQAQQEDIQLQIDEVREKIQMVRENAQSTSAQLTVQQNKLQQARGKYASLEALQEAALSQKNTETLTWLTDNQLNHNPRVAETLKVNSGYEKAVETVLGDFLEAVCVDDLQKISQGIVNLQNSHIGFVAKNGGNENALPTPSMSLAQQVTTDNALVMRLLAQVIPVQTVDEAIHRLSELSEQQSFITQDGIWLAKDWVRVAKATEGHSGVIERQKELEDLKTTIAQLEQGVVESEAAATELRTQLQNLEHNREELNSTYRNLSQKTSDVSASLKVKRAQIQAQLDRQVKVEASLETAKERLDSTHEALLEAQSSFNEASELAENDSGTRETLLLQREAIREKLDAERQKVREYTDKAHQLALKLESTNAKINHLTQNIERNQITVVDLSEQKAGLEASLENSDKPLHTLEAELEVLLEKRLQAEKTLTQARQKLAGIDHDLRALTSHRHEHESTLEKSRSEVEQQKMKLENLKVRKTTLEEQLEQMESTLTAALETLPEAAESQAWQEQLESLERRISRLGPINLAAIDEFKEVSERKTYLDAQNEDLEKALGTLEEAISKIDKETKQKFKETFDIVNNYFKNLFPKIFGGGSAILELTSDDLLETGIIVMARPPGKRNSTIHLLSGGEKALTALALVFSLFQINPAPFCMLDEVDAPLDDANVGRFCNLVKEMAKETQFIFISHNKLAIEMGNQLVGVTMREPGVSRLVAVDVAEAVEMADA